MKTTLFYPEDHHLKRVDDRAQIEAALNTGLHSYWLNVEKPGPEGVAWLDRLYHFHPLALEDLTLHNYRPKLAEYDGHLFLVAHAVAASERKISAQEVHAFLTREALVTVTVTPCAAIAHLEKTLEGEPDVLRRGPDFLLYQLLDELANTYFAVADKVDDLLGHMETSVLRSPDRRLLDRLFTVRRGLATVRRLSSHQRDAINTLAAHEGTYVRQDNVLYFHDVQNLMTTVHEIVDNQRDVASGVLEVYLSVLSNRLNDIMRRLTVVATIFLPVSFVAGLFGTNFTLMPFDSPYWFAFFILCLIGIPVGMLIYFWRSGWM
ncbi:MAG: magnesium/cobalt transporter CorA [Chloroflexota bacterium]